MPIVISNQPAQLIGDLSQNAGNFATQQAQNQMALENARFADQQRTGDEQLQLRRQEMAQQADIARQHIQAQVMAHVLSSMTQQQLTDIRDKARLQQIAAQGGNQQTLAGINASNRANIAGIRDTTQRRGQDLRTGVAYDRMGQQSDQFDQGQQQKADQFDQTYNQRDQGLGIRQQVADNQQAYQQGHLAQGENRNTIAGQQQERLAMGQKLEAARTEARMLQRVIANDPRSHLPETATARARLSVLGKMIMDLTNKVNNVDMAATGTPLPPTTQQAQNMQPPQMGMYAGDQTPSYGGAMGFGQPYREPMAREDYSQPAARGIGIDPNAPQAQPINRDAIRQLVLEGYSNEEIKAMLGGQ